MINLKKIKALLFIIPLIIFAFTITGCVPGNFVDAIEVIKKVENPQYEIKGFDYDDYEVLVTYHNKSQETIPLTEDMISDHDKLLFYKAGVHEITVTYMKRKDTFTCEFIMNTFSDDITFTSAEFNYDGKPHKIEVQGNLPEGTKIIYKQGNEFTNAAVYDLEAAIICDGYYVKTLYATLTIKKISYDFSKVVFNDYTDVYNGTEIENKISGELPEGLTVYYKIKNLSTGEVGDGFSAVNVGEYEITASFINKDSKNHSDPESITRKLTITKADYDLSNLTLLNDSLVYDGKPHKIELKTKIGYEDILNYISYEYKYFDSNGKELVNAAEDGVRDAGVYKVSAFLKSLDPNYQVIDRMDAILTIEKAIIKLNGVLFDSASVDYDPNNSQTIFCNADMKNSTEETKEAFIDPPQHTEFKGYYIDSEENIQTSPIMCKEAGLYHIYAKFEPIEEEKSNYEIENDGIIDAYLEIKKVYYTIKIMTENVFTYDGETHKVNYQIGDFTNLSSNEGEETSSLPENFKIGSFPFSKEDLIIDYSNDVEKTDAGKYTSKIAFTLNDPNYVLVNDSFEVDLTIEKKEIVLTLENVVNEYTYDGLEHTITYDIKDVEGTEIEYVEGNVVSTDKCDKAVVLQFKVKDGDENNYYISNPSYQTKLIINPMVIDFKEYFAFEIEKSTFTYDGNDQQIIHTSPVLKEGKTEVILPNGSKLTVVLYQGEIRQSEVGTYDTVFSFQFQKFSEDSEINIESNKIVDNYVLTNSDIESTLVIEPCVINLKNESAITITNNSYTYDGKDHRVEFNITNIYEKYGLVVTCSSGNYYYRNAGKYNVKLQFNPGNPNFIVEPYETTLTIDKYDLKDCIRINGYTLSAYNANSSANSHKYTGEYFGPTITFAGLPSGVSVSVLGGASSIEKHRDKGSYNYEIEFSVSNTNYKCSKIAFTYTITD